MSGKVVVITGCSSGIGRALALELHRRGFQVFATGRDVKKLTELQTAGISTLQLDVTKKESISEAVKQITVATNGIIDILINNAGTTVYGPAIEVPDKDLRELFDTNFLGPVYLVNEVAPLMIQRRKGRIINVGSVVGEVITPFASGYCATKAATHAYSHALRMELAPFGVQVVLVVPGAIQSQISANASPKLTELLSKNSLYQSISEYIWKRAKISQAKSTPAEQFAKDVCDRAIAPANPSHSVWSGYRTWPFWALSRFVPITILDYLFSWDFGLHKLARIVSAENKNK